MGLSPNYRIAFSVRHRKISPLVPSTVNDHHNILNETYYLLPPCPTFISQRNRKTGSDGVFANQCSRYHQQQRRRGHRRHYAIFPWTQRRVGQQVRLQGGLDRGPAGFLVRYSIRGKAGVRCIRAACNSRGGGAKRVAKGTRSCNPLCLRMPCLTTLFIL